MKGGVEIRCPMPDTHYSLTFDTARQLMDIAWHRYFCADDVPAYAAACRIEFARARFAPGYALRMDMRDSAVQPQDAVAMFRTCFDSFPRARRIAVVTPSAIARLQVQREMTQPYLRIFADPDAALKWLLAAEVQEVAA